MPSPFPGMDPYLEDPAVWMDFHERFITYLSDALNDKLPDRYDARIEERITLFRTEDDEPDRFRADVGISKEPGATKRQSEGRSGNVLTLEPLTLPLADYDEIHESKVHILRRSDRELITVVELLSPSNKAGEGIYEYRRKRNSLLKSHIHLVEIDLLVEGQRPALARPIPESHYCVFVSRGNRRPDCNVYSWSVRQPLPLIPIPLEAPDPDLILDLADLFRTAYNRGRYERTLRYSHQPPPSFDRETLRWANDLAKSGGTSPEQPPHA